MPTFRGKKRSDEDLGKLQLSRISQLAIFNTSITDDGIALLRSATKLTQIHIASSIITDRSMEVICGLPNLRSLLLSGVPLVTDAGIRHVERCQNLRELYLEETQCTGAGLKGVEGLEHLWSLSLRETPITDEGLLSCALPPKVSLLTLSGTQITGRGLMNLNRSIPFDLYLDGCSITTESLLPAMGQLSNLRFLDLSRTLIDEGVMPALAKINRLGGLRIDNTPMTDWGILHFLGHPNLQALECEGTFVSKEACEQLSKQQRKLRISGEGFSFSRY